MIIEMEAVMNEKIYRMLSKLPPVSAIIAWDVFMGKVSEETIKLAKVVGAMDPRPADWNYDLVRAIAGWVYPEMPTAKDVDLNELLKEMLFGEVDDDG
jgi:hypothetical protein